MGETDHTILMEEALRLAKNAADEGEVPIGAVIVYEGDIIASARNRRERDQDASGHAELLAIREACKKLGSWRLLDCDLYVTLEPCLMCAGAIIQARMRHVYFGAYDPKSGMAGSVFDAFSLPSNHQVHVTGGLLAEASSTLLRHFFAKKRK